LIFWWFRKEIAELIERGFKLKAFGVEMEANKAEANLLLDTTKADLGEKAIEQVKAVAKSTSSVSVNMRLIEGLDLLMKMATTDPRNAIKRSWELLGGAVLRAANPNTKLPSMTYSSPRQATFRRNGK
jgi:hypothetical protein